MTILDQEIKLKVSSSPHIRYLEDTKSIMLDVIIALLPALAVAAYMFGVRALVLAAVTVAACIFFEWGYRKLLKKSNDVGDLSAVVTGLLLAYCLPVSIPLWIAVIGSFFSIVIVKQLFGGLGKNFMNPALAGRAVLFSWPAVMTVWVAPLSYRSFFTFSMADAVTSATPMSALHMSKLPDNLTLLQNFFGQTGGSMGEISAFALLLGGLYLLARKVISPRIPLSYLLTVAILTLIFPRGNDNLQWMLWNLCSGGLMLGAIFMATDYSTSPVTKKGQLIFGVGCGVLTVLMRYFGAYPESVSYSILVMNACVWLIDRAALPKRFGVRPERKSKAVKAVKEAETK
jgi:electron transport complex protein RnfD